MSESYDLTSRTSCQVSLRVEAVVCFIFVYNNDLNVLSYILEPKLP